VPRDDGAELIHLEYDNLTDVIKDLFYVFFQCGTYQRMLLNESALSGPLLGRFSQDFR